MRCVYSLLRVILFTLISLPLIVQAAVLEIRLDPAVKQIPPFKPGNPIALEIVNNAPKDHKLDISITGGEHLGCDTVTKESTCKFTVSPTQFGMLRVNAQTTSGRYVANEKQYPVAFRFATYNLSFDRTCTSECSKDGDATVQCKDIQGCENGYEILKKQMALNTTAQTFLIDRFRAGQELTPEQTSLAKAAIQIRNVAEVIQRMNPDVFVLAEFDNDGEGSDNTAIDDFQTNYLMIPQKDTLSGLNYKNIMNVPTNTGELSDYDLNHNGRKDGPDDAWGHGFFHGQYAFAVFAKEGYPFGQHRTFREFKWSHMPGAENPTCDKVTTLDYCPWYSEKVWSEMRLSSKNHIDLPVEIPDMTGTGHNVHFLVSHPTPPVFDFTAKHNYKRNQAEIQFWIDYIERKDYFYRTTDDQDNPGPIADNAYFIITGDLNADPDFGDGHRETIQALLTHDLVNTSATVGDLKPKSHGAPEFLATDCNADRYNCARNKNNETVTSTFTLRADYVIPSKNFTVLNSGVFWPSEGEDGRYLVKDPDLGVDKGVSSDHRMVWVDLYIPSKSTNNTEL